MTGAGRVPVWGDTLRLLGAYPIFGSGLGTYETAFLRYRTAAVGLDFTHAHNEYLELATDVGFVGFSLVAMFMCALIAHAARAARETREPNVRCIALGCAGAFAAIALTVLTTSTSTTPTFWRLAFIAGIAAGVPLRSRVVVELRTFRARLRRPAIAFAITLLISVPTWRSFGAAFRGQLQAETLTSAASMPEILGALRRDPASPGRWLDLAEARFHEGQSGAARTVRVQRADSWSEHSFGAPAFGDPRLGSRRSGTGARSDGTYPRRNGCIRRAGVCVVRRPANLDRRRSVEGPAGAAASSAELADRAASRCAARAMNDRDARPASE